MNRAHAISLEASRQISTQRFRNYLQDKSTVVARERDKSTVSAHSCPGMGSCEDAVVTAVEHKQEN
jgi:hypothetical protein